MLTVTVQGTTLKCSHAYEPMRASLNQQTGLEQYFQHILKQGHLTEIQVCGRVTSTTRGVEEELADSDGGWGLHASDLFTLPCENVPFHHRSIPMCICLYVFVFSDSGENTVHGHDILSELLG